MPGKLRVTQIKSTDQPHRPQPGDHPGARPARHRPTVEVADNDATRGMVRQVRFLVTSRRSRRGRAEPGRRRRRSEAPRPEARAGLAQARSAASAAASRPARARPRAAAPRARRPAPAARSRPWFEGGQTPLHQRIPKLRGFKNPFKIEYEVVNVGDDRPPRRARAARERRHARREGSKKGAAGPITVNQEILRAAGLVRRLDRPMKVLGDGDLSTRALRRRRRVQRQRPDRRSRRAGGTVSVLEVPERQAPGARRRGRRTPPRRRPDDAEPRRRRRAEAEAAPPRPDADAAKATRRRTRGRDADDEAAPPGRAEAEAGQPSLEARPTDRADADGEAGDGRRGAREAADARKPPARRPRADAAHRRSPHGRGADPCSNRCSTPSARRTSGGGSSSSSGSWSSTGCSPRCRCRASTARRSPRSSRTTRVRDPRPVRRRRPVAALDRRPGVNPYINASIIMQLMTGVIPASRRSAARASTGAAAQPVHPLPDRADGPPPGLRHPVGPRRPGRDRSSAASASATRCRGSR